MNYIKQLGKDSVIYGIGGALSKSVSFFLLPIYTRIFTPAEFGTIEMMMSLVGLLTALLVMGMDSAQSFFYFEQQNKGTQAQKNVITSILQWRVVWGTVVMFIVGAIAPLLNHWFFDDQMTNLHFLFSFSGAFFMTIMAQSAEIFRLLYRPWTYIFINLVNSVLTASIILLAVIYFDQGILGYFVGISIGSLFALFFGWYMAREYLNFKKLQYKNWIKFIKFGAPLLPASLSFYLMSSLDRWFINYHHGSIELGVYAVGAQISLIILLIIETFRKAWWPISMNAMHRDNGQDFFRLIARLYVGTVMVGIMFLAFFSGSIIDLMFPEEYHSAKNIMIILLWQSFFYGFYMIASAGLIKEKKTVLMLYISIIALVVNIVLNAFLVPYYAGIGAAIATVISFFVLVFVSLIFSERLWKVGFQVRLYIFQIIITLITISINYYIFDNIYMQTVSLIIYLFILFYTTINKEEWSYFIKLLLRRGGE